MAAGGMHHVEGPSVCPFVALESDRDRRLDEPDHRHRCYAVPTPEPRAIAHQEAYCLSPGFTLCPIFQDWARRAAANPIATAQPAAASMVGEPEQLGAFDSPAGAPSDAAGAASSKAEPVSQYARPQVPPPDPAPPPEPPRPTQIERIASTPEPTHPSDPAPLPAFLASRERASAPPPPQPPSASSPTPADVSVPRVRPTSREERAAQREALIPPWDREERFNPPMAGRGRIGRGEGSDIVGRMTTILAVLALLSLALLLLVFAPNFLGGGSPSSSTPVGRASATPGATQPPATATPLPAATPQTYTIKAGDSLFGIASRFGLTLEQLQAANPQITNPNLIQVGDVIVIPPPNAGVPPASPAT
jgi:nucleoid-associated protein YgaU